MKRKTVYIWMGVIVTLTAAAFIAIYFLNLQNKVDQVAKVVDRNGPPVFNRMINGDLDSGLNKPMDVAKIGEFIYVTDTNNKRVQVFDLTGTPISKFGKEGKGKGEFKFPYGISGDKAGNVYVADLYNGNISIFDSKGNFLRYFNEKSKVSITTAPAGLRIINEKLYVTDIQKNKVFVFSLDGKKLLELGSTGTKDGQFRAPNAVTADRDGNIYVCDTGNQRVQVFTKDGKFIKIINGGTKDSPSSTFVNPRGIGIDSNGTLYVVNNLTHFVVGFDKNGKKKFEFGGMGSDNNQFYLPNGLFVDDQDEIYITDTLNQRVAVYN